MIEFLFKKRMKFLLVVVIIFLLAGCSAFQDKMEEHRTEMNLLEQENIRLCCIPDPDFPHSCGGWDLCEL